MKLDGLAHMSIPVTDLERSIPFYADVLGMKFTQFVPPAGMAFFDIGGNSCVVLVKVDQPISTANDFKVHHSFHIAHDRYEAAIAELGSKGIKIIQAEDMRGVIINGPRVYFADPDGNILEIIDRTEYRNEPITQSLPPQYRQA